MQIMQRLEADFRAQLVPREVSLHRRIWRLLCLPSFPTSGFVINPIWVSQRLPRWKFPHGISANARVGPPVPFPSFIGIQKIVAPVGGSLSALAMFSKPGLLPPSQI